MRLPQLNALRAFASAARHGSIVDAATELHVTHGAVSKQVRALEMDLGTALFERRNRGIYLTPSGVWLSTRLDGMFAGLDQTMRDFRRLGEQTKPIAVSCEPTLCLRMLIPALPELKRDTGLDVLLSAAGGMIDFRRDHVDIAIRRSDFAMPRSVETMVLAAEWVGPVAAPGVTGGPGDAVHLHSATRPDAWDDWSRRTGRAPPGRAVHYEHFYLALQAAEAGQGTAIASAHMVGDALAAGRLAAPGGFIRDGTDYVAILPQGGSDLRTAAFVAWLSARMMAAVAGVIAPSA